MGKPNLFHYATRELSQDAFICWLLEWADKSNREYDAELHHAGFLFLQALLKKHGQDLSEAPSVKVYRQKFNIDILAIINDNIVILIEDKVDASVHGDQLLRYLKTVEDKYKGKLSLPIFLKTGDQSSYKEAENAGYKLFLRKDFLELYMGITIENPIFEDFMLSLKEHEDAVNAWQVTPVNEWQDGQAKWYGWIGFFEKLKEFIDLEWGYVSNSAGGFYGAWWHNKKYQQKLDIYLQITKKTIEIRTSSDLTSELLKSVKRDFQQKLLEDGSIKFSIKKHGRTGKTSGLARIPKKDWMVEQPDGCLDIRMTVEKIKELENILDGLTR